MAWGVHQDVVRIAAQQHLADCGPVTNADHAQVALHFMKQVHYLFPRLQLSDQGGEGLVQGLRRGHHRGGLGVVGTVVAADVGR